MRNAHVSFNVTGSQMVRKQKELLQRLSPPNIAGNHLHVDFLTTAVYIYIYIWAVGFLALKHVYCSRGRSFVILSDLLSALQSIFNQKYDHPTLVLILELYMNLTKDGKKTVFIWVSGNNHVELYVNLDIQYKRPASLRIKVDTGAQGNMLPFRIFCWMFPEKLDPNGYPEEGTTKERQTILQAYNGTTIKQLGVVTLSCKHKDTEWHSSDFFVTELEGPAILELPSSRQLQLVTKHCMVQTATSPAAQPIHNAMDLKRLYPDRFKGIGDFEGELHITLQEDAQPVVQPPWKYPIQLLEEIRTELEKMEDLGVTTSITEPTDWVNALAFSRKASGGLRVCLDLRSLNQCIKRTHHKTPTLEEITNRLSGSKVFRKLDAKHGYWSIKLDEESSKLKTFNSPIGCFRFKRLPFGLNVSQDAFQQCMDQILSQCPGTIGITDNVIVYGKDGKDHDRNLHHLMKVAQKCGLVFNAAKCFIKTPQTRFFGMVFDANGVHPDTEKCAEIQAIPTPKNVTETQQFLGIIQFMAPFIPKLADQTAPLRALTKKDVPFQWNISLQKIFENFKASICKDIALMY